MKLLILTLSVVLLCSCGKDADIPPVLSDCKLLTVNFDTSQSQYYNVQYNGNNIVQLTLSTDIQSRRVYEFNSLNLLVKREDFSNPDNLGANLVRYRVEHIYDTSRYLIRTNHYHQSYTGNANGTGSVARGLHFAGFDSLQYTNGYLSQIKSYSPFNGVDIYQGKSILTWSNADLISMKTYGQNGALYHSAIWTYDLTKENKFDSVLPYFYIQEFIEYGHTMEGIRRSKHVCTSATEQWSNSAPVIKNYITTFNSKGFVKSITENAYGQSYRIFTFTYTCD